MPMLTWMRCGCAVHPDVFRKTQLLWAREWLSKGDIGGKAGVPLLDVKLDCSI